MYKYQLNWETGCVVQLIPEEEREEYILRRQQKVERTEHTLLWCMVFMTLFAIGIGFGADRIMTKILETTEPYHFDYQAQSTRKYGFSGFMATESGTRAYWRGNEIELSNEEVVYSEEAQKTLEEEEKRIAEEEALKARLATYSSVPLEEDLKLYVIKKADEIGIDPAILFAMAWQETRFTANKISKTNDYGMWQINVTNHKWLGKEFGVSKEDMKTRLMDPYFCCDCACRMITYIFSVRPNANMHQLLATYNTGNTSIDSNGYSRSIINYAINTYGYSG